MLENRTLPLFSSSKIWRTIVRAKSKIVLNYFQNACRADRDLWDLVTSKEITPLSKKEYGNIFAVNPELQKLFDTDQDQIRLTINQQLQHKSQIYVRSIITKNPSLIIKILPFIQNYDNTLNPSTCFYIRQQTNPDKNLKKLNLSFVDSISIFTCPKFRLSDKDIGFTQRIARYILMSPTPKDYPLYARIDRQILTANFTRKHPIYSSEDIKISDFTAISETLDSVSFSIR